MKVVKKIMFVLVVSSVTFLSSCKKDEVNPTGTINLSVKSSGNTNIGGRLGGRVAAITEITDFQISIREVVFKSDVNGDGVADDSTDVAFDGPYQLDLLNGADALTETIGSAIVPNGEYKEVRFKFHKDYDMPTEHVLYDRSIFIAGTIDGVPFEMWHDTSENLDIGKTTGVVVNDNQVNLVVNFTIDQFFSSVVAIDLATAVDGNQDGLIEINPNDPDGNKDIADDLKENIKGAADLLDN